MCLFSEEVFSSYACHSLKHPNIVKHPGDIVEAGCLAVSIIGGKVHQIFILSQVQCQNHFCSWECLVHTCAHTTVYIYLGITLMTEKQLAI